MTGVSVRNVDGVSGSNDPRRFRPTLRVFVAERAADPGAATPAGTQPMGQ